MNATLLKILLTLAVVIHFVGNLWHGDAHTTLDIALPAYKNVFIIIVILLLPLIGAILLWTRFSLAGSWFVAMSLLGSVLFSVYHHYVMISIDHVNHLPPGSAAAHAHFSNSAAFIAVSALAGAILAGYAARRLAQAEP